MKKIYYWSPFIDKVATVKSVINSAYSLKKYDQKNTPVILNTLGEWDEYKTDMNEKKVHLLNLTNSKLLNQKPECRGFFRSRLLYMLIIFRLFFPLMNFLKKKEGHFLIIHLITSLPLLLNIFIKQRNIILRVSGLPKFTFFRKLIWKYGINYVDYVCCPTIDTKKNLESKFPKHRSKFKILRDPIISVSEILNLKNKDKSNLSLNNDYFVSIGRLTKQKNHILLLNLILSLSKRGIYKKILIIGDGEEKNNLIKFIKTNNLQNLIKLLGYKSNVYPYLINSKALISTSLWEDPGFTIIEAAFCNTTVISSDCPNGPKEILNNNEGGYLFKSNSLDDFQKVFHKYLGDGEKKINKKKIIIKKISKDFTLFNHYKNLIKTINEK